jgi:hypothetical protein
MAYLERSVSDPKFMQRRGAFLSGLLGFFNKIGVFGLVRVIPTKLLPVIDCRVVKTPASEITNS